MKIPQKVLRTTLVSIVPDGPSSYVMDILVNGTDHREVFEIERGGSVLGTFEVLERRWWAFYILLDYLRRFASGEQLHFPIDLGDLGDPALAEQFGG